MALAARTLEYFGQMRLLTVNLHCRQEGTWRENLGILSDFIAQQSIDVISLQECAQPLGDERLSVDNDVVILQQSLNNCGLQYQAHWTINHVGFGVWYEGLGLLTRFEFESIKEIQISETSDINNWQTRRAQLATISTPDKNITLCNLHLGIEGRATSELQRLCDSADLSNAIVVGDFNIADTSFDYHRMCEMLQKPDIYAELIKRSDPTFFPGAHGWDVQKGERIDYVFGRGATSIQRVFTGHLSPRISDHMGLLVDFGF